MCGLRRTDFKHLHVYLTMKHCQNNFNAHNEITEGEIITFVGKLFY